MSKYFYAFEFWSGRNTTTGQPNSKTGRMSKAGAAAAFATRSERDEWVNDGEVTSDMQGNCREAVTKKVLRHLRLGKSLYEFNCLIEELQFSADNPD
jgi:hypothetical protein